MRVAILVAVLILSASTSVNAASKTLQALEAGDELRIRRAKVSQRFTLDRIHSDTLIVRTGAGDLPRRIAIADVDRLEVKGPRSAGSGALLGMLIGGVAGAVGGGTYALITHDDVKAECGQFTDLCEGTARTLRFVGAAGIYGMMGMVAGAIGGAAIPGSSWRPVELPVTVSLRSGRSPGLCLAITATF